MSRRQPAIGIELKHHGNWEKLMDSNVMFLDCPAYLDDAGSVRCGLPAEVEYRYLVNSSDGPLENAKIRCPLGHWFNAPIEFLTWKKTPLMRSGLTARAKRNGLYRRRTRKPWQPTASMTYH